MLQSLSPPPLISIKSPSWSPSHLHKLLIDTLGPHNRAPKLVSRKHHLPIAAPDGQKLVRVGLNKHHVGSSVFAKCVFCSGDGSTVFSDEYHYRTFRVTPDECRREAACLLLDADRRRKRSQVFVRGTQGHAIYTACRIQYAHKTTRDVPSIVNAKRRTPIADNRPTT